MLTIRPIMIMLVVHLQTAAVALLLAPPVKRSSTLVVAFSSLGWDGEAIRPEWRSTLRLHVDDGTIDLAHALDHQRSWFATDPASGDFDDGETWDSLLVELCAPYERVCLLGESMGGTAALRFSRHADSVVALVPQVDLRDFGHCCKRADFSDARKIRLMHAIQDAVAETSASIVLHLGRDADDLHQLNHLPSVSRLFVLEEAEGGDAADAPLPRDGTTQSQTTGAGRLRVVKHDIEGHAVGAGLKAFGSLEGVILPGVIHPDTELIHPDTDLTPSSATEEKASTAAAGRRPPPPPQLARTRIEVSGSCWPNAAAEALDVHGFCVLAAPPSEAPLIPLEVCAACRKTSEAGLDELLTKVERRGVDVTEEFRFLEVAHREGLRYDVPLEWRLPSIPAPSFTCDGSSGGPSSEPDTPSTGVEPEDKESAKDALARLHGAADVVARAALAAVVRRSQRGSEGNAAGERFDGVCTPPIAGCVVSLPRALTQSWHSDGAEAGLFNVFVPLLSLTRANGPTELRPGTHLHQGLARGHVAPREAPLLRAGEMLLFDYRVRHRGLANDSEEPRPVAYVTYAIGEAKDANFPDAVTLAYD